MIGKIFITSKGYDPQLGKHVSDPYLGPEAYIKPMPPRSMVSLRRSAVQRVFHRFYLKRFSILISTNIPVGSACGVLFRLSTIPLAFLRISESMFTRGQIPRGAKI
jgi:hypothetical protein